MNVPTEVQRRAYAEALRISNERALAAEKQRADLAEQALRITEQTKVSIFLSISSLEFFVF